MEKKEKFKGKGPGILFPIVDFNKCSGAGPCIPACPFDVFELKSINKTDKKGLNWVGKLKTKFNNKKAYAVQADLCNACGLCVIACPEKAIKLKAR